MLREKAWLPNREGDASENTGNVEIRQAGRSTLAQPYARLPTLSPGEDLLLDDDEFTPKLGRMRAKGAKRGARYLHRVLAATALAGGLRRAGHRHFDGSRIGRGAAMGRLLGLRDRYAGARARRAIVKTRLVRLGGRGLGAARAHLRYIQRDGVTREGEPGQLYAAREDVADGKAFLERCEGDRHQFRFIVSAEDGAEYRDLKPLTRRFMADGGGPRD